MYERQRLLLILAIVAFASIATLSISIPSSRALATPLSTTPKTFTVIVSRNGFNGTSSAFSITVQQGDAVRIIFVYGDGDLSVDNPHAIAFEGYGIQTVNVGKSNPTVTVEFVAEVSGTFNFYCYIPCLGMENLLGHLIVTPTEGPRVATTLAITVSSTNPNSHSFLISAKVEDPSGKALVGVPVKFFENTTFGKLLLNTVPTNSEGVATLNYTATRVGIIEIIADNLGSTEYGNASNAIFVSVPSRISQNQTEEQIYLGVKEPGHTAHQFYGLPYPPNLSMIAVPRIMNLLAVILAGVVVLGVWSTYGYVLRQIASLPKYGAPRQEAYEGAPLAIEIPIDSVRIAAPEMAKLANKTFALLFLVPLFGVTDMLVVNSLGLSIPWRALALVGLAVAETLATVTIVTSQSVTQ